MRKKKTGGRAFPCSDGSRVLDPGMTLRDYFAAKAMQAMISNPTSGVVVTAELAYKFADDMLEAREK